MFCAPNGLELPPGQKRLRGPRASCKIKKGKGREEHGMQDPHSAERANAEALRTAYHLTTSEMMELLERIAETSQLRRLFHLRRNMTVVSLAVEDFFTLQRIAARMTSL